MKNYKLIIEYDGTKYNGWQKQGNTKNTLQERFISVLSRMCDHAVSIHASGRTDAGVHAKAQVANCFCETEKTCEEMQRYLNQYLPEDIRVLSVCVADDRFHSRLNAVSKTYEYKISTVKADVFTRKFVYTEECCVDVDKMRRASKLLLGTHDFIGFSSVKKTKKSTIRTIHAIDVTDSDGVITISINGSGFLYNMVRIIAGTLFEIGKGAMDEAVISEILSDKNRAAAGPTMPACGLSLTKVYY